MFTHGDLLSCSSSSVAVVDVLWSRALGSLPAPLAGALRDAGLDDASTLVHFPRWSVDQFEEFLRGSGGSSPRLTAAASSDATSRGTSSCTYGHGVHPRGLEWTKGGDPKTDHEAFVTGGDPRTDHASFSASFGDTGGDPRTDQATFSASFGDTGGDPRTDQASFVFETLSSDVMAATCPPYRPGRLASATAKSSASAASALPFGSAHPDGFPCQTHGLRDGLTNMADFTREALPEGSSIIDRSLHRRFNTGFFKVFSRS